MSLWQSLNFYKRVKRDLVSEISEATWTGASISLFTIFLLLWLCFSELTAFLQVTQTSRVVVEPPRVTMDTLQIVFNIDFPKLKCEYLSIQATNFLGTRSAGLAQNTNTYHLSKDGGLRGKHVPPRKPPATDAAAAAAADAADAAVAAAAAAAAANGTAGTPLLTVADFDYARRGAAALIVNFCVPTDPNCRRLAPVWENVSYALHDAYPDARRRGAFALARVACDTPEAESICAAHEVDVYPAILVIRHSDTTVPAAAAAAAAAAGEEEEEFTHETYHGALTLSAITKWVKHIADQSLNLLPTTRLVDSDRDGALDSHDAVGCRASGMVQVQQSPGILHFRALSEGKTFDFSKLDMTHTITHLAFGHTLTRREKSEMPAAAAESATALSGHSFKSDSDEGPVTYEHYLKVVRHRVKVNPRWTITAYGYTAQSAHVRPPPIEAPTVRIAYDTLPFTVEVAAEGKPFATFATGLCGIVGGVVALAGLLTSALHRIQNWAGALSRPARDFPQ